MTTPLGKSADDELLSQAGANPFCGPDYKISKDKANPAIRSGKIEVRETGCRPIAAKAGVIWHRFSAVAPGDKGAEHRMSNSRACCASTLIKVARILMQQRRQDGAADHYVRKTIRRSCAKALTVSAPPLPVVGTICGLPDTGHAKDPGSGHWIRRHFQRKLKFHLRGQRCRILFIRDVEVWHEAQYPLMFLRFELLSRDLHRVIRHLDLCQLGSNLQLNSRQDFELSRCERHAG